jgi:hypothetical protein
MLLVILSGNSAFQFTTAAPIGIPTKSILRVIPSKELLRPE